MQASYILTWRGWNMMKWKLLAKYSLAFLLVFGLVAPAMVYAEEERIDVFTSQYLTVNGQETSWSVLGARSETFKDSASPDRFEYWDAAAIDFQLSTMIENVAAGTYTMSVQLYGESELAAASVMYAKAGDRLFSIPIDYGQSGWEAPSTLTLSNIVVEGDESVELGFIIKGAAEHYGYLSTVTFDEEKEHGAAQAALAPTSFILRPGAEAQLQVEASAGAEVEYSTENAAVATVSETGGIVAVGNGTTKINVEIYENGEVLSRLQSAVFVSDQEQVFMEQIQVEPIEQLQNGQRDDFIMGVDISTLDAMNKLSRKFYDREGNEQSIVEVLKENGVNWIRLRTWVDPSDGLGNAYGGGNTDTEALVRMAKEATAADMKLLVDLHYSDFWADPGRQNKPKGWADYTEEQLKKAVYDYTIEVLEALKEADIYPDMIQIGNEINNGFLWPSGKTPTNAHPYLKEGIRAVRDFQAEQGGNKHIDIVIHRADPHDGVKTVEGFYQTYSDLDYDIIGLSYYPFWHGTMDNISTIMNHLAAKFDKRVAIVETSYAYTLEDPILNGITGHVFGSPQAAAGGYLATVQGQANALRDVIAQVAAVPNGKGAGIFYWEPGWLPGVDSGWATTYAAQYQGEAISSDGGSGWANQALFNYFGEALPSIEVFNRVRAADDTYTPPTIAAVSDIFLSTNEGNEVSLPSKVKALFTDDTYREVDIVSWEPDSYNYTKAGLYTLTGLLSTGDKVTLKVEVRPRNYILNASFENTDMSNWQLKGTNRSDEAASDGTYALHFWGQEEVSAKQIVTGLPNGKYQLTVNTRIGLGGEALDSSSHLYAIGENRKYETPVQATGWESWRKLTISDIEVKNGQLEVGIYVLAVPDNYGDFDEWELIRTGDLTGTAPSIPSTSSPSTSEELADGNHVIKLERSSDEEQLFSKVDGAVQSIAFAIDSFMSEQQATSIMIEWGSALLELDIKALQEAISKSGLSHAGDRIVIQLQAAHSSSIVEKALQWAVSKQGQLTVQGGIIALSIVAEHDKQNIANSPLQLPIKLTFPIEQQMNEGIVALYEVAENGQLRYIGGKLVDGKLVVYIADHNNYVVGMYEKQFNDVEKANDQLKKLVAMGILEGNHEGHLMLDRSATRAEMSKILIALTGLDHLSETRKVNETLQRDIVSAANTEYKDVPPSHWAFPYIQLASNYGFMNGIGGGSFQPQADITYEELFTIIQRVLQLPIPDIHADEVETPYTSNASHWAIPAIAALVKAGIVHEEFKNTDMKQKLTRAELVKIIYASVQYLNK